MADETPDPILDAPLTIRGLKSLLADVIDINIEDPSNIVVNRALLGPGGQFAASFANGYLVLRVDDERGAEVEPITIRPVVDSTGKMFIEVKQGADFARHETPVSFNL